MTRSFTWWLLQRLVCICMYTHIAIQTSFDVRKSRALLAAEGEDMHCFHVQKGWRLFYKMPIRPPLR